MSSPYQEEEIDTSISPLKKAGRYLSSFFSSRGQTEESKSTEETEGDSMDKPDFGKSKCPFGFDKLIRGKTEGKKPEEKTIQPEEKKEVKTGGKCPFGFDRPKAEKKEETKTDDLPKTGGKCPFGYDSKDIPQDNDVDSEDDSQPTGGCPVMNKGKKDPQNKHFEQFYEIPCFGPYDFLFLLRGNLETEEWLKKTEKLRKYPRYLRNTLFYQAQEKLQKVHEKEFPVVFFIYDDIKQKANRLFRRKKFKEAIEHLTYSYGLLKWIQFKDKKRQSEFIVKPSLDAILDDDLEEKQVYLDDVKVEEDSFKACVVYLLEIMAYAHMELRQYSCAIECLDECAEIAEDKVADVYFRRSQARTYNRFSSEEELQKAMEDIEKALSIKDEQIYKEHKELLTKIINEKKEKQLNNVKKLIERAKKKKEKMNKFNITIDEVFLTSNDDAIKQYKILKEMRDKYNLAVKFFNETKNDEQLKLTYKEYESFHASYETFKFFYKFNVNEIDPKVRNQLTEEENKLLSDPDFSKLVDEYRYKLCEGVFSDGNFNIELFQYALEKVFDEERKEEEAREKEEEAKNPKVTWTQYLMNITKSNYTIYFSILFIICSIGAIGAHFYMYSGTFPNFNKMK